MIIRKARQAELYEVVALVKSVVKEKYGHLFGDIDPVPSDSSIWEHSIVSIAGGEITGVGLASGATIDDLWIRPDSRNAGIGSALLASMEQEIRSAGFSTASLVVVAENVDAQRFYSRHGWQLAKRFVHAKWGYEAIEMQKILNTVPIENRSGHG